MLSIIIPVKDPEPYLSTLKIEIDSFLYGVFDYEILIQKEKGLTNAVVEGVKRSIYPWILVMDADGSHDPYHILEMLIFTHRGFDFDLIIGCKDVDESSFFRVKISQVFRSLGRFLIGTKVKDPMSGFVLGKKSMFELIEPSMGYKFLLQMLIHNPRVKEIPISFHKRKLGKSKANLITGLRTLLYMSKLGLSRRNIF